MEIRQLHQQDADQYHLLRLEALQKNPEAFAASYEEEKNQSVEKYINRFQTPQDSFTFGVFEECKLIGVATLVKERRLKVRHRANIVAMYVTPEKRGYGIGKSLIIATIEKANSIPGIEQINLTVITTNQPAKRLYSSIGFEVFGTEKRALKYGNTYYDQDHMVVFL